MQAHLSQRRVLQVQIPTKISNVRVEYICSIIRLNTFVQCRGRIHFHIRVEYIFISGLNTLDLPDQAPLQAPAFLLTLAPLAGIFLA